MKRGAPLPGLFLVSAAAVGFETALTRYFAVASWSEYGYWVISIVMVGFALSGVAMAVARDWALRRADPLLAALPMLLILAATAGYRLTTTNPFNPLALQNPVTFGAELAHIAGYYAALLPFFFLTGIYVSLCFVLNETRIGRTYAADLSGAGVGAVATLALMYWLHPFHLVPALLVPLAAAALCGPWRLRAGVAALAVLVISGALLLGDDHAAISQYKPIYAPLHTQGGRVVAQHISPRGVYSLLDDFTERVDTDVSNDAGMLNLPGPPRSFGLYRDGSRVAALPRPPGPSAAYAAAALSAAPYALVSHPRVLLAGASGGFRIAESLALGARRVDAIEPDPVLTAALRQGLGPSPAMAPDPRVRLLSKGPLAAVDDGPAYDLVDISADYLDEAEANVTAFTAQAIATDLRALAPDGIVSIPVSIREFPAYAVRMLATVRRALLMAGVPVPADNVIVYRSAWNLRILASRTPWSAARIAALRKFCDDRSFDVSYYPGIDIAAARANIYNDLPPVSFETGEVASSGAAQDAVADEAEAVLRGDPVPSEATFNLAPITLDRPFYYAVLRLDRLRLLLHRIEMLPQAEIGPLVNLAVLAQAAVIALLVLLVPAVAPFVRGTARQRLGWMGLIRPVVYFAALGLGFLFIEITLIGKASFYLNDRTSAFALVLTGMLIFSGLGSLLADRVRGLSVAAAVIVAWCAVMLVGLDRFLLATLDWPFATRIVAVLVLLAPVSVALGLPFPLGLKRAAASGGGFLPWAWGLNGAFSVVATPLANLIATLAGYDRVLLAASVLYVIAFLAYPSARRIVSWQDIPAPSHDAG